MTSIRRIVSLIDRSISSTGRNDLQTRFSRFWFSTSAFKSYLAVIDRLIVGGTNFLTMVIVGRACGLEDLGVFALAWTILLGINVAQEAFVLSPFTVFCRRDTDAKSNKTYAWTTWLLQIASAAAAVTIALLCASLMTHFEVGSTVQAVAWSLAIAIPAVSMREFVRRYLFAKLETTKALILDALVAGLQFAGLGAFSYTGSLSPGSALVVIAMATAVPALTWLLLNRKNFQITGRSELLAQGWRHWRFGRWIGAGQLSDLAVTHGVAWLVAALAGTAATGMFAACNSLIMVVNPLILGIGNVLLPRTAQANHEHGSEEVNRIVWKTTSLLALSVGLICLGVALFGEVLIGAFYSLGSLEGVQEIIVLLALANFVGAVSFAVDNGLLVVNRPDVN
ncbi:MAG: hypothetical protein HKN05_12005, partial [Rhizobiales bacterium]|nr:hypothetical protein [Hyphomicrobiales bacterium]